jgi:hypothetical protein
MLSSIETMATGVANLSSLGCVRCASAVTARNLLDVFEK